MGFENEHIKTVKDNIEKTAFEVGEFEGAVLKGFTQGFLSITI